MSTKGNEMKDGLFTQNPEYHQKDLITKAMVEDWVGSDNLDPDSFLDLLVDLINEKYTIENFKKDVTEYADEYFDRTGKK
jgi:hypothetical protein